MKILSCVAKNFGSYKHLDFVYAQPGLSLVYGPTGSGKTTLMDAPVWALFGVTAKDGSADDVLSWGSDAPTVVDLIIEDGQSELHVTRVRGVNKNDLYFRRYISFQHGPAEPTRGKDLKDTQKLIQGLLGGLTPELFMNGSYFCPYSSASRFFSLKAPERRAFLAQLVDLSEPTKVSVNATEELSVDKKREAVLQAEISYLTKHGDRLMKDKWEQTKLAANFEAEKQANIDMCVDKARLSAAEVSAKIAVLENSLEHHDSLEADSKEVSEMIDELYKVRCPECGGTPHTDDLAALEKRKYELFVTIQKLSAKVSQIEALKGSLDALPFLAMATRYKESKNTHAPLVEKLAAELDENKSRLGSSKEELTALSARLVSLTQIKDVAQTVRASLLCSAIQAIQARTNRLLETHFDTPLRVELTPTEDDNLSVSIQKSGYECAYRQLSKGQRQLLSLCFSVSVMEQIDNHHAFSFGTRMFDEALDGLDSELKIKAFALFDELSQNGKSVVLIDHSTELQQMFERRYRVSMDGDNSSIQEEQ